jgi:putative addiction module component (TIGR02574 family)
MELEMNARLKELFDAASELPDHERAELAGMLLDTLDGERDPAVEAAWAEEVERRVRQVDAGEVQMIPWEQKGRPTLAQGRPRNT